MTPAEFFIKVYDLRTLQNEVAEDYKNKVNTADSEQRKIDLKKLATEVDAELHKCDPKSQKTFYLLAKEKIQKQKPVDAVAVNELKSKLGLERI